MKISLPSRRVLYLSAPLFWVLLVAGCAVSKEATAAREAYPGSPLDQAKETTAEQAAPEARSMKSGVEEDGFDQAAPQKLSTRPVFQVRPPELLARAGSPQLEPLPLVAQDISVVVAGHRARVVMDLVFQNPSSATLGGTLMVALPDRASPCYLGMFQGLGVEADPGIVAPDELPVFLNPEPVSPVVLLASEITLPATWDTGGGQFRLRRAPFSPGGGTCKREAGVRSGNPAPG